MKPTILVLTSTFPRNDQDHEPRFVADLCLHLKDSYNIVIVTQHRPGTPLDENYNGFRVKRFRYAPERLEILSETGGISNTLSQKPWAWLLVPLLVVAQILAVNRSIRNYSPSIIHCHWLLPQTLSAIVVQLFRKHKVPVVCTSHGADIYGLNGKLLQAIKSRLARACDVFCVVSNAMKTHVTDTFDIRNKEIVVSPMGADLKSMFTPGDPALVNSGKILFVGRLVEKKGVRYLLFAVQQLIENGHDFTLEIVGYGPEQITLQALSKDLELDEKVKFTGSLPHSEVADLYRSSEVCVLPFVESDDGDIEGLGLVVVEAMGCKCPVIAGNVPAIADLVTDGITGLVCDPKSTESLCAGILKLHKARQFKSQLIENAFEHVHREYSWEACSNRYLELFRELGRP